MTTESSISQLTATVVEVPLKGAVETAHGRFTRQRSVVVHLVLAGGIEGWGEANPVAGFSSVSADEIAREVDAAASKFMGLSLRDRAAWEPRVRALRHASLPVEMAVLDATARMAGLPLGALLGTPQRREIPLSGWIGWGSAAEAVATARDFVKNGFEGLKIKIGSGSDADVARIAAIREAVGPKVRLIVDAGEAYDARTTVALLRRLEPLRVAACEQPVPREDLAGLSRVRSETGVPVILDESVGSIADLDRVVEAGAVDIIKIKLIKHEGVEAALALARAASERGVGCTVGHGFALGLTTLAEGHIASVLPNFVPPGEMVGPLKMIFDVAVPPPDLTGGRLVLPDAAGLGAVADLGRFRSPDLAFVPPGER